MNSIEIRAGQQALSIIRERGLQPDDVRAIFAASGSAKWLAIYGLDKSIFGRFLKETRQAIALYGTSIGAFKLAAAAQREPAEALERLAQCYIEQSYDSAPTAHDISAELSRILAVTLDRNGIEEILSHPSFRFHCGAIRSHGPMASGRPAIQQLAVLLGFGLSLAGRSWQRFLYSRTVFRDPRGHGMLAGCDAMPTDFIDLSRENFMPALTASGSLPVYMYGVSDLAGDDSKGVYRDGGLIDYHPVPSSLLPDQQGIVLYPHFFPYLKEGWFDKFAPWRQVKPDRLSNVVMISPSAEFVAALPEGRIPDRRDFYRYGNDNKKRQMVWSEAMKRSEDLGEAFLEIAGSDKIVQFCQPFQRP